MSRRQVAVDSGNRIKEFKKHLIKEYAKLDELAPGQQDRLSEEEKRDLAAEELEMLAQDDKQTRYYFYALPRKKTAWLRSNNWLMN